MSHTITEQGLVYDLSEHAYHADPVEGGSLSSTGAKRLLEAPAVFKYRQEHPEPPKDAFDFGSAVHSLVLGVGAQPVCHGYAEVRSNAAKERVAEIRAEGGIPVKQRLYDEIVACADAVMSHPIAGKLFQRDDAYPEVSAFTTTEDGLWLRSRMDLLIPEQNIIVDLKTSASAQPEDFTRAVTGFGYDVSAVHYRKVWHSLTETLPSFVHVVVSKTAPYLVTVAELDSDYLELGESRWERAYARYRHGMTTGQWPGIPTIMHKISPPAWAVYQEEDKTEMEKTA